MIITVFLQNRKRSVRQTAKEHSEKMYERWTIMTHSRSTYNNKTVYLYNQRCDKGIV